MSHKNIERERKYNRECRRNRRREFFSGKSCALCGSKDDLNLHHIDPKTKEDHRVWSWRETRRKTELAKCIVVCRRCHAQIHAGSSRICGSQNASAKLTEADVIEIRKALAQGMTQTNLAAKYQVVSQTIQKISSGETWGWLEPASSDAGNWRRKDKMLYAQRNAEIRRLRQEGWLLRELAGKYHLQPSMLSMICNGKRG